MAKDWKGELKDIISSQQNKIKTVIDNRDKRESERMKKIKEIKNILKPRLEYVKELIEKDKYLLSSFEESPSNDTTTTSNESSKEVGDVMAQAQKGDEHGQFIDLAKRGEFVKTPKISEGPAEMVLIMPSLSDVNRLDLMYQIEFKDEKPVLHAFDLLPAGKMKNNGSAHDKFEDFIQDSLKRFLLSWFTRKEGTELDKERKFTLVIEGHGLR
jgi:hypothetical protein